MKQSDAFFDDDFSDISLSDLESSSSEEGEIDEFIEKTQQVLQRLRIELAHQNSTLITEQGSRWAEKMLDTLNKSIKTDIADSFAKRAEARMAQVSRRWSL